MSVREFLRLERRKVVIALIMPSVHWIVIEYIINYLHAVLSGGVLLSIYHPPETYILFSLFLIIFSPLYYPFACSLVVLWDYKRRKIMLNTKTKVLVALGFIFFNPISIKFMLVMAIWIQVHYFSKEDFIKFLF
ncbi:hypothetical protein [Archaeoglobus neptunius]|uniref:hypothetical protein n=1 Tax=Archaeoglobus neptunius TaxID=2798580 RepID=UPI00192571BB|nr:hypothetical protein [Archaeoglobus neptunius]